MISKDLLLRLYIEDGLSVEKISKELNVSREKVCWWMNKYAIPMRTRAEAAYLQYNKTFKIKTKLTNEESTLWARNWPILGRG
jgi:orotate phosphoribosyltransferase-like protein